MKRITLLALTFVAYLTLSAQVQWTSDWKLFTASYIYDAKYLADQKLGSNYVRSLDIDKEGAVWFAVGGEIKVYFQGKVGTMKSKDYGTPRFVNLLKFDNNGDMWVATDKGLYKFDGEVFTNMEVPEIKLITEIAVDSKNKIWVAGYNSNVITATGGGLSVYDGSQWKNYKPENSGLPKSFVEDITFDKYGNAWMVAGIQDAGVVKFDGTNWIQYTKDNSGLPTNTVRAIEFDNNNVAWFGTPKGLVSFDGTNWVNHSMRDLMANITYGVFDKILPEPNLLSLAVDKNNVIWIGTEGNGVIRFEANFNLLISAENSPLPTNYVRDIVVDDKNRKFFLTGVFPETWSDMYFKDMSSYPERFGGAVMYQEPVFTHFPEWKVYNSFSSTIPGSFIEEIAVAKDGKVWLAGCGGGVASFENNEWKAFNNPKAGLVGEMVNCVAVSDNGEVYAGAQLNGLYRVTGELLVPLDKDTYGYKNKNLIDMDFDKAGNVWMASIMGLDKFDGKSCEFFNNKTGLPSNNIYRVKCDSKGRMWIGTPAGIGMHDKGTWKIYDKKTGGINGYVFDVAEDSKGTIWAATGKGLFRLDGEMFVVVEPDANVPKYFLINCLTITSDDKIWLGTDKNGVITFDGQKWNQYHKDNSGVYFDQIRDIQADAKGGVWISARYVAPTVVPTYSSTPTPADLGEPIKKKIVDFDPKGALIYFKGK